MGSSRLICHQRIKREPHKLFLGFKQALLSLRFRWSTVVCSDRQAILQAALQYFRHGGVCCAESAVLLLSADFYCREAGSSLQQQSIFGFAAEQIAAVMFHAARVYGGKIGRDVHTHMKVIYLQRTSSDVLLSR